MRRLDFSARGPGVIVALAMLSTSTIAEVPEELAENWYRTEVLIFVREDEESRLAEQWEPLPVLSYPEAYRYLLDPAMADRRLSESLAFESQIDTQGRQILRVPSPIEELLDHSRPDAITQPPPELDLLIPADEEGMDSAAPADGEAVVASGDNPELSMDDPNTPSLALDPGEAPVDLTSPVLSLPYELLDRDRLEFRAQARSLRRRGQRVMFHGSWWARLEEQDATPALIMDRSGDMDSTDWPALQGSLQIYRSRYLHIVLDLWLNTLGDYLPEGWQIASPPLAPPSLQAKTLSGEDMNPWAPAENIERFAPKVDQQGDALPGSVAQTPTATPTPTPTPMEELATESALTEQAIDAPSYPWRHAIVHRQTRRMRSGEIHYLDHPVIGVIVKITPMSEEALPLQEPEVRTFRERHALPVEVLPPSPEELRDH